MNPNDNHQVSRTATVVAAERGPRTIYRAAAEQLEKAKASIASEFREALEEHAGLLRLALNEAEALAWQTGYSHLFFPLLAREKAQAVAQWHQRQRLIQHTNGETSFAA